MLVNCTATPPAVEVRGISIGTRRATALLAAVRAALPAGDGAR